MMKESRKEKVKNYLKDHKGEIAAFVGTVSLGMVGYCIGWHYAKKTYYVPDGYITRDEPVKALLAALDRDYPVGHKCSFAATNQMNTPISVNDLGKLGEIFKEAGCQDGKTFTHFLAIGDAEK